MIAILVLSKVETPLIVGIVKMMEDDKKTNRISQLDDRQSRINKGQNSRESFRNLQANTKIKEGT